MKQEFYDFRSAPMDSPEGRGIAYERWRSFWYSIPDDVMSDAFSVPETPIEDYPDFVRDDINEAVVEDADLVGFWVSWHQAGGFGNLEAAGWHRATIFRKIRKFRTHYGAHPDEYDFPWISLDLGRAWNDNLANRIRAAREADVDPDFFKNPEPDPDPNFG